jgi:hypothetical protein
MIPIALFFFAASTRVDLVDEVYRIPAGQWRYLELGLKQKAAFVAADFEVRSGSRHLRLKLMRREDLERMRTERSYGVLAATEAAASGRLRYPVSMAGDYVVVIDNQEDQPAEAHVQVSLDFGPQPAPAATHLSPKRQAAVIGISFAVFFGIVSYSARRLLRGIKR